MITIECPFCDEPIRMDGHPDAVRCETCRVELEFASEDAVPVIAQAVMQLFTSRDDQKNWARAIAMMRHGFGGHPYGADAGIVHERKFGRVGDFYRDK